MGGWRSGQRLRATVDFIQSFLKYLCGEWEVVRCCGRDVRMLGGGRGAGGGWDAPGPRSRVSSEAAATR